MIAKIAQLRFLLMADNVICIPRERVSGACRLPEQRITPALVQLLRRPLRAREIRPRVVSLRGGPLHAMGLALGALGNAKSRRRHSRAAVACNVRLDRVNRLRPGRKP